MWPAYFNQFGSFQTSLNDSNRGVMQISEHKLFQTKINSLSKEKALRAAAEDKVHHEQAAITHGAIAEANSALNWWVWQPSMQKPGSQSQSNCCHWLNIT